MKLIRPIREALTERFKEQTGLIRPPDDSEVDAYGYTGKQRVMLVKIAKDMGANAGPIFFAAERALRLNQPEQYAAFRQYMADLMNADSKAKDVGLPSLCVVALTGTKFGSEDGYVGIVTHGLKGLVMGKGGAVDSFQITHGEFRPATPEEIDDMMKSLTEQQIQTIMTHNYFTEVIMQAIQDDDDDDGDVTVDAPPSTPVPSA